MSFNLAVMLRETASATPGSLAAVFTGGQLTYGELDELSDRLAAGPGQGRARPRRRGGAAAAQYSPVPCRLLRAPQGWLRGRAAQRHAQGARGGIPARGLTGEVLITWEGILGAAAKGAAAAGISGIYAVGHAGRDGRRRPVRAASRCSGRRASDGPARAYRHRGRRLHVRHHGRPKGAELTHIQLYMNADIPGRLFDVRPDDVVIAALPFFHVFGLSSILNVCVRFGCTMSLIPRFDAGHGPDRDPARPGHHLRGRAHHVRRPAVVPGAGQLRHLLAAGGDLGRCLDTGAGAGCVRAALRRRDPGRLRDDGDGVHDDVQPERHRPARLQRRQADLGNADAGMGRGLQRPAARKGPCGRGRHARPARDEGLPEQSGGDGRGLHR